MFHEGPVFVRQPDGSLRSLGYVLVEFQKFNENGQREVDEDGQPILRRGWCSRELAEKIHGAKIIETS